MRNRLITVSPIFLFVFGVPLANWFVGPLDNIYVGIALAVAIVVMFVLKRKYPESPKTASVHGLTAGAGATRRR